MVQGAVVVKPGSPGHNEWSVGFSSAVDTPLAVRIELAVAKISALGKRSRVRTHADSIST